MKIVLASRTVEIPEGGMYSNFSVFDVSIVPRTLVIPSLTFVVLSIIR